MNIEHQYLDLIKDILDHGVTKADRTGTGTRAVFGRQLRHNMDEGFPLLTTKSVPLRLVATELIWFLQGRTDLRWLVERNCNIWVGDAYKTYKTYANSLAEPDYNVHLDDPADNRTRIFTEAEFIEFIIKNDDFSKKWGDLGPIYGKQWRHWCSKNTAIGVDDKGHITKWKETGGIDQLANVVDQLKNNPDSRRIMLTAWNPPEIAAAALPPCHYGFQFSTRELTEDEKVIFLHKNGLDALNDEGRKAFWEGDDVPKRKISLMWNQRSVDTPLGLPFNIASYALLLTIIAKEVKMIPDELICSLGDTHIYLNQIEGANEQLSREPYNCPELLMLDEFHYLMDDTDIPFTDKIDKLETKMFKVQNYKHHPKINYPLSN